jgi:hypothetical protein
MDKDIPYSEIAKVYGKSNHAISVYATAVGVQRKPRIAGRTAKTAQHDGRPTTLGAVEAKLLALQTKQAEFHREMEELKRLRAELQLRFERDGDTVLVYGVAPGPMAATVAEWTQFLNMEGARKLREYIAVTFGKGGTK